MTPATRERLRNAGALLRQAREQEARAVRAIVDVVEALGDERNVAEAVRLSGMSRAGIYRELARRRRARTPTVENTWYRASGVEGERDG